MALQTPPAENPATFRAARPARRRSGTAGFWLVGAVFALATATAAAPAPLYMLYQQRDGFSSFTLTLIFAAYALGVAVSLLTVGHLSDGAGRRRVLTAAVLVDVLALLVFVTWSAVPALLLARFVSGLGVGMLTATATAYLTELHAAARPPVGSRRAEAVATAANLGGLGLGPLVTGLLAEYAPAPLRTPYVVFLFLLVTGALAVAAVPETVAPDPAWRYRPLRVAVPVEARTRYAAAAMLAFSASAVFGLFTSLTPSFLSTRLGLPSPAVSGAVTFLVLACAAGFQLLVMRRTPSRQAVLGIVLLGSGLALVTAGLTAASLTALLAGGALAGAGAGAAYAAAVGSVIAMSRPDARGEALAGLFLGGFAGMSVPVLGLGLLLLVTTTAVAVVAFSALLACLLLLTLLIMLRTGGRHR
ncbi:MFS transporter [Actinocorallia populi]|uniref:MFS transporter n=1 Tax=Actinocorallia populi TaxID=2079200 RepID=UPI0013006739|nr:MFS transporter [Actinocorallia populi]